MKYLVLIALMSTSAVTRAEDAVISSQKHGLEANVTTQLHLCIDAPCPDLNYQRDHVEVYIDDLRSAINALNDESWAHSHGWYKRLQKAAETVRE